MSNKAKRPAAARPAGDESTLALWRIERMKLRTEPMAGQEFPLVAWRGNGRIVASDDVAIAVLVKGMRASLTWDRLRVTWERLVANHTLGIEELGGGADAVGIISLFAWLQPDVVEAVDGDGLLVLKAPTDTPSHQYADMDRQTARAPSRRAQAE